MKAIFANVLLVYLLATTISSCNKDANGSTFSPTRKLYARSSTQKSAVRLFTNGTEIKNQTVINNFIKNSKVFDLNLLNSDKIYYFTFTAADTAIFNNDNFNYPEKYSIVKNGNQFLFYSKDVRNYGNTPFRYFNDMLKYTNPEKPLPVGGGFPSSTITKLIKVGYGSYSQIEMRLLSYKFVQNLIYSSFFKEQSGLTNEFNEAVIPKVGVNDTLAVQEFSVKYN